MLLHKDAPKQIKRFNSSRPISFLDGAKKLYERLLLNRMLPYVTEALSPNRYGFRLGRRTMDALNTVLAIAADAAKEVVRDKHLCILIIFHISNAFNSAPWHLIDVVVTRFGAPQYIRRLIRFHLSERTILVPSGDTMIERGMTCGATQGSILGPPCGMSSMTVCYASGNHLGPRLSGLRYRGPSHGKPHHRWPRKGGQRSPDKNLGDDQCKRSPVGAC